MKDFWKKLIGSAKKEVSVEKNRQAKGKLNVNDLIYSYLKFVEAEKKRNYKNLKIFNKKFWTSVFKFFNYSWTNEDFNQKIEGKV
ncbi:hypothetical protein I6I93_05610 [Peptoniphilus harei]|uniref:Uncharacterized protein n=1 Tax=Peptoniphilus harei TaxID=54005 RepID=A0A2X1YJ73_9FIRM|nr:hypothetical protein [Peptoniphilus harei]QQT90390.1 hypothetical protein I6I93_05610 [Peptoniphilus harei]SPY47591.1 Uncharacterised protein [Peptoniphilus harei]